jgi:predicted metal-dependent HD superfamily phosphohydrolase
MSKTFEVVERKLSDKAFDLMVYDEENTGLVQARIDGARQAYDSDGRYHHDFGHVIEVTDFIVDHLDECQQPFVPLWAAVYHDKVMSFDKVPYGYNEQQSTVDAGQELIGILPQFHIGQVQAFVLATIDHSVGSAANPDLAVFLDADMSVLAAPWPRYLDYADNIRKEYARYSNEEFKIGRTNVLEVLLNKAKHDELFFSRFGKTALAAIAQSNMAAELEMLSKS